MPLRDPPPPEKLANGVIPRRDGRGDGWALAHREKLSGAYLLTDVDGYFGAIYFDRNTSDQLFVEYVDDQPTTERQRLIREVALVGLFDRKRSRDDTKSKEAVTQTALWLGLLRKLRVSQPSPPRFFYVIGPSAGPWEIVELGLSDGHEIRSLSVDAESMPAIWERLGLTELRTSLRSSLLRSGTRTA